MADESGKESKLSKQLELVNYATRKSDELIDEFSVKSLQLENRHRLQLLNDVKSAKNTLLKEINEHLRMVDTFDLKSDLAVNLKRVDNQCKALKKSVESKLEVDKLAGHLKLKNALKSALESNLNQSEINELYEVISKLNVKSFFDFENAGQSEEPATSRELARSFEIKGKKTIENLKRSLAKNTSDFQNEVVQLKNEIDKQSVSESSGSPKFDVNLKSCKETLKAGMDKELKRILDEMAKAGQSDQLQDYRRQLTTVKKIYLNELAKSDCSLTGQCLEHIKTTKKKLWLRFILIFGELVELIGRLSEEPESGPLLRSLNECIERGVKNYDAFIEKTNEQKLELCVKKLKELDDQFAEELRAGEKRTNRPAC